MEHVQRLLMPWRREECDAQAADPKNAAASNWDEMNPLMRQALPALFSEGAR